MPENRSALIVDDEPMIRELVSEILRMRGYEVRTAQDGEEGVSLFRQQPCDLIVLDISMPRMDGLEALKHFRVLDGTVGIVLMTGHGGEQERIEGQRLGAVFMNKPFNIATVNTLLDVLEEDRARWTSGSPSPSGGTYGPIASESDRRRQVRVPVDISASVEQLPSDVSPTRPCRIVDVSLGGGGVQFQVLPPFPQGAKVSLTFPPLNKHTNESITIAGVIVWADLNTGHCGVQFHDLDEQQLLVLENIAVESLRRRPGG